MRQKPVHEDDFHRKIVFEDGKTISVRNPIAFYHKALMEYSPNLDLEVIVLFEKLIVLYNINKCRPFNYKRKKLINELHIKRTRLENARAFLRDKGIVNEKLLEKGVTLNFSINSDRIIELVPELYKMPVQINDKMALINELRTFFKDYLYYIKGYVDKIDPSNPAKSQKVRVALITPGKRGTTESDNNQGEDDNDESNEINS